MTHPSSCHDSDCTLSYRQHLLSINFSATALPTRTINHTPGAPDEPVTQTLIREQRWERDMPAYKRLVDQGYDPPRVDGARYRETHAEDRFDIEQRPVTIDYSNPN